MKRSAGFAGSFYPGNAQKLAAMVDGFLAKAKKELGTKEKADCVVAPHAGYIYSGQTAAYSYSVLKKAKTFIILSPNHTGYGSNISIFPAGEWETPLGKQKINSALAGGIAKALGIETDESAHLGEHSIEVQLPFLQRAFGGDFDFVAITIAEQGLEELMRLGKAVFDAAKGKDIAVIASSDFTHYEPLDSAKQKDLAAIRLIEKLDAEGFHNKVVSEQLSICGFSAITAAMQYCREKGKKAARLLHYDTSGTATGDNAGVVGYASIGFY